MLAETNIIGIIIAVVVAIIASFLKRKEEPEQWELPPELKPKRDRTKPPVQPRAETWEEELRRLLNESSTPPPIVREVPPPQPPPLITRNQDEDQHIEVRLDVPHPNIEPTYQPLPGLTEATQRYSAAASLEERVQQHMHDVTTHRVGTTSVAHAQVAPEVKAVVQSLRNPQSARSAILASIILGPPRALEPR